MEPSSYSIRFHVPGRPRPQQRPGTARNGRRYQPAESKAYRACLVLAFCAARPASWPKGVRYALGLVVTPQDQRHGDLSNYFKQVEDALNRIAWDDDKQITEYLPSRIMAPDKNRAGLWVTIETR